MNLVTSCIPLLYTANPTLALCELKFTQKYVEEKYLWKLSEKLKKNDCPNSASEERFRRSALYRGLRFREATHQHRSVKRIFIENPQDSPFQILQEISA